MHASARSILLPLISFCTFLASGCANSKTIMIPRYMSEGVSIYAVDASTDPFRREVYEVEAAADASFSLLAVALEDRLILGARSDETFAGDVTWKVGDLQLGYRVAGAETSGEVPIRVTREEGASGGASVPDDLVGRTQHADGKTTVHFALPHAVLKRGDGTLTLSFDPDGDETPVSIPASGRLRGVYLRY